MSPQVINIERKKYAVGLFWQPLSVGQNPRDFAKTLAKQVPGQSKLYAEFKTMVAVGSRTLGHRKGMKLAAAEVINSLSEYNSFLAAFFTPQGFWIIAVRNNIVIFDQLFASESDAKRECTSLAELPDWGITIAPQYWNMAHTVERSLRDVAPGSSKATLMPISGLFGNVISLALLAVFVLIAGYFFQESIMKMLAPRPQQANINPDVLKEYKLQLDAQKAEFVAKSRPTPRVPPPYESLPDADARADQCWRGIAYVMQQIPGWVQITAECDNNIVSAQLQRTYGTLAGMHESVRMLMENVFIEERTDSDIIISVELPLLPAAGYAPPENLTENVVYSVNSLFQTIGASVSAIPSIETIGVGLGATKVNLVVATAASKLKPDEFIEIFDGISPLYMASAKWDARTRIWNYEVRIYVK